MPVWKFVPTVVGEQTALEDASLDLAAYYQAYDDLATYLRAHDGLELEDVRTVLSAYYQSLEDAPLNLSAYYQALEDLKTRLEAAGFAFDDLRLQLYAASLQVSDLGTALSTWGEARNDIGSLLQAAGYGWSDMATSFDAVVPLVLSDLCVRLDVTDGTAFSSLGTFLAAVTRAPSFRSVMAQRVSSVVQEV